MSSPDRSPRRTPTAHRWPTSYPTNITRSSAGRTRASPTAIGWERDGRRYPALSFPGENALLSVFDPTGGITGTIAFYKTLAEWFRAIGFDGVSVLSVFPDSRLDNPTVMTDLENAGVLRFHSSYVPNHIDPACFQGGTYEKLVNSYAPPADPHTILAIGNAGVYPHAPMNRAGFARAIPPDLFEQFIGKAVDHLDANPDMQRIITCYNISEWAEGGAGLQPNVQDGFDTWGSHPPSAGRPSLGGDPINLWEAGLWNPPRKKGTVIMKSARKLGTFLIAAALAMSLPLAAAAETDTVPPHAQGGRQPDRSQQSHRRYQCAELSQ